MSTTGIEVHKYFHLVDKTPDATANLVGRNDRIWQRMWSGNLLIPTPLSVPKSMIFTSVAFKIDRGGDQTEGEIEMLRNLNLIPKENSHHSRENGWCSDGEKR